jgi:ubiquinone/menaquinone biosynthesis C-methylase UbiE
MANKNENRVCPVEKSGGLDNGLRRFLQNPQKILKPYIKEGMTVLDLGCGPGFFSLEIAKLLGNSGTVIAADLQQGMLDKVRQKIRGTDVESRVQLHKCLEESINLNDKVDFALAFYMIHEVPDAEHLFRELKSILNPGGQIFIIEPKFHVSKKSFAAMTDQLTAIGLEIEKKPKIFFSRSVVVKNS